MMSCERPPLGGNSLWDWRWRAVIWGLEDMCDFSPLTGEEKRDLTDSGLTSGPDSKG